jgi:Tfp pilus assembly PilM family ATPase
MEEVGDKLLLTDIFFRELEPNAPGIGGMQNTYDQIQPAIDQLTNSFDLENCLVWVNLPGSAATTRFVRLPPVDDKKAAVLAAAELKDRIPVPADELAVTQTLGVYDKESSHGRPLVFSAARLNIIEKRMELFEQTGLKVDGMQADPNAIVNLMAWEFADTLAPPQLEPSDSETAKKKKWGKKDVEAVARFDEKTPTICWVDAGAASTTLIYVSGETHWFWTVEQGGDNLTSTLARSTKKTHDEAEGLKTQPEKMEQPAQHFAAVDAKLAELRSRFKKIAEDALKQNDRFDPIETYVSGGAALTLGWTHKLLGTNDQSGKQ